jgi:hypothetical protein
MARKLRGEAAHGTQKGKNWLRVNFPTAAEKRRAKAKWVVLTAADRAQRTADRASAGKVSEFVGVSWRRGSDGRRGSKWVCHISHEGKQENLGSYDDEWEAAWAVDKVARKLRGKEAHGGSPKNGPTYLFHRLNFPTPSEVRRADSVNMPAYKPPAYKGVDASGMPRVYKPRVYTIAFLTRGSGLERAARFQCLTVRAFRHGGSAGALRGPEPLAHVGAARTREVE